MVLEHEELERMVAAEAERLGVGSPEFLQRHNEIMAEMEQIQQREQARKEERDRVKQILNVHDVMAILEVSESKAYNIIRQLNKELAEKHYITIPGKISRVYFEEKCYGVKVAE